VWRQMRRFLVGLQNKAGGGPIRARVTYMTDTRPPHYAAKSRRSAGSNRLLPREIHQFGQHAYALTRLRR